MGVYERDSPYWWYRVEGTAIRKKTDFLIGATATERRDSKKLAEAVWREAQNNHGRRRNRLPMPLEDSLFKAYATAYDSTIAGHKGRRRDRELLVQLRAFFDNKPLTAIDPELVSDYLRLRTEKKPGGPKVVSVGTANREVDLLKAMIRDAVPKYLDFSPLKGMKRWKGPARRRRTLKQDDEKRLLKVATDPQDRAILILGIDTLQRLGDLLDIKRSDREGILVDIPDPKNGEPNRVPLSPRAAKALDAIPDTGDYYFSKFRVAKDPENWRGSVNQRMQLLAAKCSPPIVWSMKDGVTFHGATRKTGVTRHARNKANRAAVQKLGGWKDTKMVDTIYTEVDHDDVLKLVGRAPQRKRA